MTWLWRRQGMRWWWKYHSWCLCSRWDRCSSVSTVWRHTCRRADKHASHHSCCCCCCWCWCWSSSSCQTALSASRSNDLCTVAHIDTHLFAATHAHAHTIAQLMSSLSTDVNKEGLNPSGQGAATSSCQQHTISSLKFQHTKLSTSPISNEVEWSYINR